jgi:hypothetical protein
MRKVLEEQPQKDKTLGVQSVYLLNIDCSCSHNGCVLTQHCSSSWFC